MRWNRLLSVLLVLSFTIGELAAREHSIDFESEATSCEVILDESTARLVEHRRTSDNPHSGDGCENIVIQSRAAITVGTILHALPKARVIDDLTLGLWVKSNRDSAKLSVRVVFPQQPNPATGEPLTLLVTGESYSDTEHWQRLVCDDIEARIKRQLPTLRKKLQSETGSFIPIDTTGSFVDLLVLEFQSGRGATQFSIDDLSLNPVIAPRPSAAIQAIEHRENASRSDAEFRIGRLFVSNRPFFPLIVPYHGETSVSLSQTRFNVAWVPDYRDAPLLEELKRMGLRGMAIPPRPAARENGVVDSTGGNLAPFGPETNSIMLWYLGTKIRPEVRKPLLNWEQQIRDADWQLRRPIMGDVTGQEREYSRHIPMISVHRPALQSTLGLIHYREFLASRRRQAKQGTFFWTWMHTEPDADMQMARERAGKIPLMIEPEQYRLQAYAALASGVHGLGYWSQTPFDAETPAALERRLAISQLNMEISLLEPWLATDSLQSFTNFTANLPARRNNTPVAVDSARDPREAAKRDAQLMDRQAQSRQQNALAHELEAAILRTDYGTLVLPVWYGDDAQYVPGALAANDIRIVVPGVGDTATAWEVSTTNIVRIVDSTRVAGGRQIALRKFDMTSAVLFTDDMRLIDRLQSTMAELREPSARVAVDLAHAKWERVNTTALKLQAIRPQADAPQILVRAREFLRKADKLLQDGRFHDARLAAADCMQLLRILQNNYWNDAVQKMFSPASSPHTLCFETLPDHWEMVSRYRMARESEARNILRSGDFEDFDTMVTEGWRHDRADVEGIRSTAEVSPQAHRGAFSLRLVAAPKKGDEPLAVVPETPVTVTSPAMTVHRGQILYVSGWVKVPATITGSYDGATLTDSLGGASLALRWRKSVDWQEFHLVREVHETADFTLELALTGIGEVWFDDLKVVPLTPNSSPGAGSTPPVSPVSKPAANPLDFWKKIPGLEPKKSQ